MPAIAYLCDFYHDIFHHIEHSCGPAGSWKSAPVAERNRINTAIMEQCKEVVRQRDEGL
jgi:hypothetical protein